MKYLWLFLLFVSTAQAYNFDGRWRLVDRICTDGYPAYVDPRPWTIQIQGDQFQLSFVKGSEEAPQFLNLSGQIEKQEKVLRFRVNEQISLIFPSVLSSDDKLVMVEADFTGQKDSLCPKGQGAMSIFKREGT